MESSRGLIIKGLSIIIIIGELLSDTTIQPRSAEMRSLREDSMIRNSENRASDPHGEAEQIYAEQIKLLYKNAHYLNSISLSTIKLISLCKPGMER